MRPISGLWAILGLAAGLAAAEPGPEPASGRRYNVVWIVADDLNTDVGCYGQPLRGRRISTG